MTNFHITLVDDNDCNSIADDFILEAEDRADAELRLLDAYGNLDYIFVADVETLDDL